jgi:uncharacterized protein (DUF697 family)
MADHVVIVPIQIGMVIAIGKAFGIEVTESVAKSMVLTGAATLVGLPDLKFSSAGFR